MHKYLLFIYNISIWKGKKLHKNISNVIILELFKETLLNFDSKLFIRYFSRDNPFFFSNEYKIQNSNNEIIRSLSCFE